MTKNQGHLITYKVLNIKQKKKKTHKFGLQT